VTPVLTPHNCQKVMTPQNATHEQKAHPMNSQQQLAAGHREAIATARSFAQHCRSRGSEVPPETLALLASVGEGTQGPGSAGEADTAFVVNESPEALAKPDPRRIECGYSTMQVFQCRAPIQTRFPASECRKVEE
jgi:hypothetical protein